MTDLGNVIIIGPNHHSAIELHFADHVEQLDRFTAEDLAHDILRRLSERAEL